MLASDNVSDVIGDNSTASHTAITYMEDDTAFVYCDIQRLDITAKYIIDVALFAKNASKNFF